MPALPAPQMASTPTSRSRRRRLAAAGEGTPSSPGTSRAVRKIYASTCFACHSPEVPASRNSKAARRTTVL